MPYWLPTVECGCAGFRLFTEWPSDLSAGSLITRVLLLFGSVLMCSVPLRPMVRARKQRLRPRASSRLCFWLMKKSFAARRGRSWASPTSAPAHALQWQRTFFIRSCRPPSLFALSSIAACTLLCTWAGYGRCAATMQILLSLHARSTHRLHGEKIISLRFLREKL